MIHKEELVYKALHLVEHLITVYNQGNYNIIVVLNTHW